MPLFFNCEYTYKHEEDAEEDEDENGSCHVVVVSYVLDNRLVRKQRQELQLYLVHFDPEVCKKRVRTEQELEF